MKLAVSLRHHTQKEGCMSKPELKDLFEAGAHFGHKSSRWHPKMAPFIHSKKNGIHIINLEKTADMLSDALDFVQEAVSQGKQILLVGTKRQTKGLIEEAGSTTNMPFVTVRWFGGTLTNFKTMQLRVKRLKDLEAKMESGELANRYNKLEVQRFQEEIEQLNRNFGGVREMNASPGAVFITDVTEEEIAVKEANKLGIPVIGITDTNANPTVIDYPIPANDDAIKTLKLIVDSMIEAIMLGKTAQQKTQLKSDSEVDKKLEKPREKIKIEKALTD